MHYKNAMLTLKGVQHWINIPFNKKSLETEPGDSDEADSDYYEDDLIVVWESGVQPLSDVQRLTFLTLTIIIVVIAVVGNLLVLYVNLSRLVLVCKRRI
jgi:hypothetical protein